MTAPLYFSRARLRRDASLKALLPLFGLGRQQEGEPQVRFAAGHALVWSLFADGADRARDFLYRDAERQTFYLLSARPPQDHHSLFDLDIQDYTPRLEAGDHLSFVLRANPVVRRSVEGRKNAPKDDVVMHALRQAGEEAERGPLRRTLVRQEGVRWLARVAESRGFTAEEETLAVDGYRQHRLPRPGQAAPVRFSTLDFEGRLTVTEPETFLSSLAKGLGAARAFGCGLMLLRRA